MAANRRASRVIERRSPHPPIVQQEAERFNQIDRDAKTRCKPQQRPGILRDIRFKQSEPQIDRRSVRLMDLLIVIVVSL